MTGLTQPWHIVLILLIALLLFGGKRLPEIGRSLGSGMREFKDSISGKDEHGAKQEKSPDPERIEPTADSAAPPGDGEAAEKQAFGGERRG